MAAATAAAATTTTTTTRMHYDVCEELEFLKTRREATRMTHWVEKLPQR
jgi:hypothetical protein